jgi:hypothetical protein
MSRERVVMGSLLLAAGAACVLGAANPPAATSAGGGAEVLALVRVATTTALAICLLLGPGLLVRELSARRFGLGFVPLPGLALLIVVGALAWVLSGSIEPRVVCFAVLAPVLGLMFGALIAQGPHEVLDPEERRVLIIVAIVLGIAVARSIWALSTVGELYEGTVSRTLVAEGRPDSRISFIIPQLVANGRGPYSAGANALYLPYNFSSRGPFAGLAATPLVLMTGGRPGLGPPEAPWSPFDAEGFMAYRLAMICFGSTVLLSLWQLVQRFAGAPAARLALLLGTATPFVYADLWFTWPKLLGASFVLLAAVLVFRRRSFGGGLAIGAGYLMHPSAILGLTGLGPLSLWPPPRPRWRRPDLRGTLLLALGAAIFVGGWRLANGSHYFQGPFLEYFTEAYPYVEPSLHFWFHMRGVSLANTVVPLFLPLAEGHNVSINTVGGISPGVVHFFFQYWTGIPFGFAIVFFPMLLASLWRALRRWPWAVGAGILFPFAFFIVYWGASSSGVLREGLQWWVFAVLAVVALQQAAAGFPWCRSPLPRAILTLRGAEVLALAVVPVLGTHGFDPLGSTFRLDDLVAFAAIVSLSLVLVVVLWRETGRLAEQVPLRREQEKEEVS